MRIMLPALLFTVATPLLAQPADVPLASAESSREAAALFHRLDTNHDGWLSAEELAAPGASQGNWIAVDRNGDGRITQAEFGIVGSLAGTPRSGATGGTQPPQESGKPAQR